MVNVLITGAAGFIGFHLAKRMLADGANVIGVDNVNDYYDVRLKEARLDILQQSSNFHFERHNLADSAAIAKVFADYKPVLVVNLGAQAGVRYSLKNPRTYIESNVAGFLNILEGCRDTGVEHLVYASSSSVYGANGTMPFSVHAGVDHPVSLYAATKKANELMAHTYSHLFGLPTTGLRFFTVYGPWGRPDMALFHFTKSILEGRPIDVYNEGKMQRDFTYIDDIVEGIVRVANRTACPDPNWSSLNPDPASSSAPYRVYNIGNHQPIELLRFIEILEVALGKTAVKNMLPLQPGEVLATYADIDDLVRDTGFSPNTPIEQGIGEFVRWYRDFYQV